MLIQLTAPYRIADRTHWAGTALDVPPAEAERLITAGQAQRHVLVEVLKRFNSRAGVTYAAGERAGFDEKTAAELIAAGVVEPCRTP
jgi:hypothetical protein